MIRIDHLEPSDGGFKENISTGKKEFKCKDANLSDNIHTCDIALMISQQINDENS